MKKVLTYFAVSKHWISRNGFRISKLSCNISFTGFHKVFNRLLIGYKN